MIEEHADPNDGLDSRYRVTVIGLGHRGYNTHFLAAHGSRSLVIVAVCDNDPTTIQNFSYKHPSVPAFTKVKDLLAEHRPDFAVVAVPHKHHMSIITLLAAEGIPVLKEKPAAVSPDELLHLLALNVKVGVAYQKRFESRYIQFKACLPLVGQVASFRAVLMRNLKNKNSTWRAIDGVGVTEDLGSHMIDILAFLFGQPDAVTSRQVHDARRHEQSGGGDDVSDTVMEWFKPMHLVGHLHLSRVAHKSEESLTVTGAQGTICLQGDQLSMFRPDGSVVFCTNHDATSSEPSKRRVVQSMLQSFGAYVLGQRADCRGLISNCSDGVFITQRIRDSTVGNLSSPCEVASLQGRHFVWPIITDELIDSVVKQMKTSLSIYDRSGIYETFEERWRTLHDLKHAVVFSSGTAAIHAMFEALQLMPGDEILTPVYTFFATATPILQYGAIPIFCDILPNGNIDPEEIPRRATTRTKALIVTHMWGMPCDMPSIMRYAHAANVMVLEDCSHAHGAMIDGKLVGTWGDAAAWSLQAQKNITGGQAGVLATDSDDIYARAVVFGHFNKRAKQEVPLDHPLRKFWLTGIGLNLRAHPLAIAMANSQLNHMQSWMACREKYANIFLEALSSVPFLRLPSRQVGSQFRHAWYAFVMNFDIIRAPAGVTRDAFVAALKHRGLEEVDIPKSTGLLHELPLFTHTHEALPRFGSQPWHAPQTGFKVAQEFYDSAIKLPVWATEGDMPVVMFYAQTIFDVAMSFYDGALVTTFKAKL